MNMMKAGKQLRLNEMKMSVNDYNEVDLIKHNGLSYVAGYFYN